MRYLYMKKILRLIHIHFSALFISLAATGCIDDSVTTSGAAQPEFSSDTISLGTMWAGETSPTAMMRIYNRGAKGIILSRVAVAACSGGNLRLNLDGMSGNEFHDIEIRANDSLFLLAEATPAPGFTASVEVTANGLTHTIPVSGTTISPMELTDMTFTSDFTIPAGSSVRIGGSLTVAPEATLTIEQGATLYFRDGSRLTVEGTIIAGGTPEAQITLRGDRLGNVVSSIPFDVMAGQWEGIDFGDASCDNELTCVSMLNTRSGISLSPESDIALTNCRISNSQSALLTAQDARIDATGCEFSNAASALLHLSGGNTQLTRCTLSNHYLFSFPTGAAITLLGDAALTVTGSIIHGDGPELSAPAPLSPAVLFSNCLFGSNGSDDSNFNGCIWQTDPLFMLDLDNYVMDFRLNPDSPARNKASHARTDRFGVSGTSLGAYN